MKRMFSIAMLGLLLCSTAFAQDEAAKQKAAGEATQSWLALLDRGDYAQSWEQAASSFKSKLSKEDWEKTMQQLRPQLGAAGERKLLKAEYMTELPGAPKGEYVVLQYKTQFAGVGAAIETVSPALDTDGKWHVSGYYVKPAE